MSKFLQWSIEAPTLSGPLSCFWPHLLLHSAPATPLLAALPPHPVGSCPRILALLLPSPPEHSYPRYTWLSSSTLQLWSHLWLLKKSHFYLSLAFLILFPCLIFFPVTFTAIPYSGYFIVYIFTICLLWLECDLCEDRNFYQFCLLLYPQPLDQCRAHKRHSNIF